jgi:hypothetical protein
MKIFKLATGMCVAAAFAAVLLPPAAAQELIEATTVSGEKVRLHPNGRWEYVDAQKAAAAKTVADQYPENQLRPKAAQGCLFGIGRCIMPGDKDYNRGTLNPAKR